MAADLEGTEGIAGHLGDSVALEVELGKAREALERPEVGQSTDPVVAQIQERQPLVVAENSRLDFSDLIVVSRWSLTYAADNIASFSHILEQAFFGHSLKNLR